MKQISEMKTSEMVAEYNQLTGKSIKKFSTRAAGEKQLLCARLESGMVVENHPEEQPKVTEGPAGKRKTEGHIKAWSNVEVKAARSKKDRVVVTMPDGKMADYRSVHAAFQALDLPMEKHIPFRGILKKQGVAEFNKIKFEVSK